MFKYVMFTVIAQALTTLEFRGSVEGVEVHHFDKDVVSLKGDESLIDALIAQQPAEINCTVITQAEFKEIVGDSAQLNRIREVVATEIAKKYTFADEIGMSKRDVTDVKRVAYEAYVAECIAIGDALKAEIGY